jgi:subtilisin family serine protease
MSRPRCVLGLGVLAALVGPPLRAPEQHDGPTRERSARFVDVVVRGRGLVPRAREVAPGLEVARLRTDELEALGRSAAPPDLAILPPLRRATDLAIPIIGVPALETQGLTGRGVYVGMVDSGFDVRHPALRDAAGATRFAWLLDYSRRVRGKHSAIEDKYSTPSCLAKRDDGSADDGGACTADARCTASLPCAVTQGAVFSGEDIDALLRAAAPGEPLPTDEEGHGTLAMGIAAGSHLSSTAFRGVATEAKLVAVKSDGNGYTLNAGSVIQGIHFIFDRAKEAGVPASVNLSLSSDFAVRDGSDPLGPAVAALARGPGRVVVVAAGNAGDPLLATHQTASVAEGEQVRVGLHAFDGFPYPHVQVIVSPHPGSNLRIGCDTPSGTWVVPVERGKTRSASVDDATANVIFNPSDFGGRLPAASPSALVQMEGRLDVERSHFYGITLEGTGTADLWINGGRFEFGVREQTVGSPAMHPELIAVGASASRSSYTSRAGEVLAPLAQQYDEGGLLPVVGIGVPPAPGQVAAFSGAGPGPRGVIKPDLVAPGVAILSAATSSDDPRNILFGSGLCPTLVSGARTNDPRCLFVDADHAAATGTSFASPFVTGAAAVLLQVDPTLTQEEMRIALQAGVHRHRSPPRFAESASVGELDVPGALDVARRLRDPVKVLPVLERSWLTANSHYAPTDGTRPLEVLVHLRAATGEPADGFDVNRFAVTMNADGEEVPPSRLERLGPGLWAASFDVGRHGSGFLVTLAATFDQAPITAPVALPVAPDPWQARYPSSARGASCAVGQASARATSGSLPWSALALVVGALVSRRRARTSR